MNRVLYQKKRRFRTDPENPYKSRYMVYSLMEKEGETACIINAEQYDYVLKEQVAYAKSSTPEVTNRNVGQMLIEHLLNKARSIEDVAQIHTQWQQGNLQLIHHATNVLVEVAIKKRFARNLKRL